MERFLHSKETIRRLCTHDGNFQSLCEAYWRCAHALWHWNRSSSEEAPVHTVGYGALLVELEEEMLQKLHEINRLSGGGSAKTC